MDLSDDEETDALLRDAPVPTSALSSPLHFDDLMDSEDEQARSNPHETTPADAASGTAPSPSRSGNLGGPSSALPSAGSSPTSGAHGARSPTAGSPTPAAQSGASTGPRRRPLIQHSPPPSPPRSPSYVTSMTEAISLSQGSQDAEVEDIPDRLRELDEEDSQRVGLGVSQVPPTQGDGEQQTVIWGTNINVQETMELFVEFLRQFALPGQSEPLYPPLVQQMVASGQQCLNLDCCNLFEYNAALYHQLVGHPEEMIVLFDLTLKSFIANLIPEVDPGAPQVRPFNLNPRDQRQMRDLDPVDIDKMIGIKGMVTRVSNIMPDLLSALFRCQICHFEEVVNIDRGRIQEPSRCQACNTQATMMIIHNRCAFADKQVIKLQETPDSVPEGETPSTITLVVYRDLVDVVNPGDRVDVTGLYRAQPTQILKRMRSLRSVYKTFVDVIQIRKSERGRFHADDEQQEYDLKRVESFDDGDEMESSVREREEKLIALSQQPDIYEKLTRSLAPSIWELEDIKKGILCQLFGGTHKKFEREQEGRFRGEINVLLVGDPGTSKSQLLQYVHKIAPRGMYTSGKGSSAVGLTAYVTKDPDTKQHVLESGALVLSDRGICCIDEFDKMTDHTRSVLHEVMEQQTVSIAKAGIICTLNARTSILASANPVQSRYNPKLSVVDNIDLPPTLLSRFDLIYLVLDKANEDTDRRLARHLVSLYFEDVPRQEDLIETQTFTEYISYARANIHPQISDEARDALVQEYLAMRRMGGRNKKTITATPRQLESLIRLSEALARMHFSQIVTTDNVKEAARLVRVAIQEAAMDPRTGTIDMDLIATGRSASSRTRTADLAASAKQMLGRTDGSIRFDNLLIQMNKQSSIDITPNELRDALAHLQEDDAVAMTGDIRNPRITLTG